jgi:DNA-binding CsgD family transcriptional regulator
MDLKHGAGLALGKSRGRQRRGRPFLRDHGTIERENRALELLVKGMTTRAIAAELEMSQGAISVLIRRALEYRAESIRGTTDRALALILERYERLLERWWPLATGDYVDPETESGQGSPNIRALDGVLKIMAQQADLISRLYRAAPPADPTGSTFTGGIHVHNASPADREQMIGDVLAILGTTREKHVTIEGQLAQARTTLAQLDGGQTDDRPGPPPTHTEETP